MTSPRLAVPIRKCGRMYPYPPVDPSGWPRNQWDSVNQEDIPVDVTMLPSLTNCLSVCDKPGLRGWAAEEAIKAMHDDGYQLDDLADAVSRYKYAFNKTSKKASDRGTRAHTLAHCLTLDLPLPSSISEEDEAYADAYLAFWSNRDPQPLYVEATVYGDGWAGTADLFAEIGGVATVLDYKSKDARPDAKKLARYGAIYDEARMQLSALAAAERVAVPQDDGTWTLEPLPDIKQGIGVVLYPDGTYSEEHLDADELARWFDGFQGALKLWHALKGVAA